MFFRNRDRPIVPIDVIESQVIPAMARRIVDGFDTAVAFPMREFGQLLLSK
jgi:hypothetical protein